MKSKKKENGAYVLYTGSPHYVKMVSNLMQHDVVGKGRDLRNSPSFQPNGLNVNFVEQQSEDEILVRTFERGVEDETLSCGTGVVASAIVNYHNEYGFNEVRVSTRGGKLSVEFDRMQDGKFTNIWLVGPAEMVYSGSITLPE